MSHNPRRDLGTPIFLVFAAILIGCCLMAWRSMSLSSQATAYLRVDRNAVGGTAVDYMIFKETQGALLKSEYVLKTALTSDSLSRTDITWHELSASLHVQSSEDELLCLKLRGRNNEETVALLNAVLDAYKSEVLDKDRLEKMNLLVKIRTLYEEKYNEMVEENEAVKSKYAWRSIAEVGVEGGEERLKLHQKELQDLKNQLIELKQDDQNKRLKRSNWSTNQSRKRHRKLRISRVLGERLRRMARG